MTRWVCPICGSGNGRPRWAVPDGTTEGGVDAHSFRPSSNSFGLTAGMVVTCSGCGHGSLADLPAPEAVETAYRSAVDQTSLQEEDGQIETARRALVHIERSVPPGMVYDIGCWTGSFLIAAAARGWSTTGVEPSLWASARGRERGLDVRTAELDGGDLRRRAARLVAFGDVLEHLRDPGGAVDRAGELLEPGGLLWATVPDAGSLAARVLGRRWWSVMPMHLQYFTRSSLSRLLTDRGFTVLSVRSHAKVFSAGYYAERLNGYQPALGGFLHAGLRRSGLADRPLAPDLRDRIAVIARASSPPGAPKR